MVVACDPIALSILKPPGECGADVAVGEGQPLGNRLDYGGPSFGFFCATEEHIRRMPGRIAGETTDVDGRRGFVLDPADPRAAHPPREGDPQHLHRAGAERARRDDPPELARQARASSSSASCWPAAPHTRASASPRSTASSCSTTRRSSASSRSRSTRPVDEVLDRCAAEGIGAGYPLGRDYPEYEDGLLVAITERRTAADIDRLAEVLGERRRASSADRRACRRAASRERPAPTAGGPGITETPMQRDRAITIFERSVEGRRAAQLPDAGRARDAARRADPRRACCATSPAELPEIAEPEIVRHYNRISRRNFDLDTGFYPLGSLHDEAQPAPERAGRRAARPRPPASRPGPAARPGRAGADVDAAGALSEICGLPHVSLQPSAGSHGELAGLLLTRAYHADRGEERTEGPDPGHRARHQPGHGDDGRLRGRQGRHQRARAGWTSTTCAPRPTSRPPA